VIHGTGDESVGFAEAKTLMASSTGTVRLLEVEGSGHTFGATHPWRTSTPELETVFDATLNWLVANLTW
jgi:hypothetical protein